MCMSNDTDEYIDNTQPEMSGGTLQASVDKILEPATIESTMIKPKRHILLNTILWLLVLVFLLVPVIAIGLRMTKFDTLGEAIPFSVIPARCYLFSGPEQTNCFFFFERGFWVEPGQMFDYSMFLQKGYFF